MGRIAAAHLVTCFGVLTGWGKKGGEPTASNCRHPAEVQRVTKEIPRPVTVCPADRGRGNSLSGITHIATIIYNIVLRYKNYLELWSEEARNVCVQGSAGV